MELSIEKKKELKELIDQFAENKSLKEDYDKLCKRDNQKIKDIMGKYGLDTFDSEDYTAKYYSQNKESFDAELAVKILKQNGITNCIKTVEVLDDEMLESMLYNNEIPEIVVTELGACTSTNTTWALKVSKRKKEK